MEEFDKGGANKDYKRFKEKRKMNNNNQGEYFKSRGNLREGEEEGENGGSKQVEGI